MHTNDQSSIQEKETGRVEAFSDGVFAIAITLLVLDIKVPSPHDLSPDFGLTRALLRQWPQYLAFFISFINILIMWTNHHNIFTNLRLCNRPFLFLNGFLLLTVIFIPFPTSLLAEYMRTSYAGVVAAIFAGSILLNCLSFNFLWAYASRNRRLLAKNIDPATISTIKRNGLFGLPFYVLAIIIAFISAPASVGVCFVMAVFFAITGSINKALIRKNK